MTRTVRVDDEAARELEAAVAWYESRAPGVGLDLLRATIEAKARLVQTPGASTRVPGVPSDLRVRRLPVRDFPYWLVFIELADHFRVIAFAHMRRRPNYWRTRTRRRSKS